jgi:hypothetical protein
MVVGLVAPGVVRFMVVGVEMVIECLMQLVVKLEVMYLLIGCTCPLPLRSGIRVITGALSVGLLTTLFGSAMLMLLGWQLICLLC